MIHIPIGLRTDQILHLTKWNDMLQNEKLSIKIYIYICKQKEKIHTFLFLIIIEIKEETPEKM